MSQSQEEAKCGQRASSGLPLGAGDGQTQSTEEPRRGSFREFGNSHRVALRILRRHGQLQAGRLLKKEATKETLK